MECDIDWQLSKKSLGERFRDVYKLSKWTDCVFSVGESKTEQIKCHKLLLAASSPVFEALFYGPLANFGDNVIRLPDLEPETFKSLLEYIYCDSVDVHSILDAGMLLYASKKYMLPHLSRICIDYIIQHMQISNLHEVLEISESLSEDKLLDMCLKVLRRYSVDMWSSVSEHLSRTVVCRLLDQDASKSSESELWVFLLSWAETECKMKDIDPSPENIRRVLDEVGLLQKIRFLTFSKCEIMEFVKPSGVISDSELMTLSDGIDCVCSDPTFNNCSDTRNCGNRNNVCDKLIGNSDCSRPNIVVPKGFNSNCSKRMHLSSYSYYCPRKILSKRKTWAYGGKICTKVTSPSLVHVTGFEVFTRIPSTTDFCISHGNTDKYDERIVVKIFDDKGLELSKTDFTVVAEFNASQHITLYQPVWFYPERTYTVTFELPLGQYPLSQLSHVASNKIATFRFEDFSNYPEGYIDFSFISAVMFAL